MDSNGIEVFATCAQSSDSDRAEYVRRVAEVARWSERSGCRGILVYSDNRLVDPWLVSQIILQSTHELSPLVAIQPAYMHPYAAAKMVASFGHLYGRKIYLNMVAGGFKNDLLALGDETPHDRRYDRLSEYTQIVLRLLASPEPVTYDGEFYRVKNLRMTPPSALRPGVFVSGSSAAGRAAARAIGAVAIKYPKPSREEVDSPEVEGTPCGVRVGIIAREESEDAWRVARARFPEDRRGQLTHQLAMKVSDSMWHRQLSSMAQTVSEDEPYWLVPFENYKTMCPYLVGSYERVAEEIARYVSAGYRTFILDIPPSEEELRHTGAVFERATQRVAS